MIDSDRSAIDLADNIQGWMSLDELCWLYDICDKRNVIEVGIWKGRSTTAIASSASKVLALDTWPHNSPEEAIVRCKPEDAMLEAFNNLSQFSNVSIYTDRVELEKILANSGTRFDVLFIDGCHRYDAVASDLELERFVADGGIISGHDRNCAGVKAAIWDRYGKDSINAGHGSIWWLTK